MPTNPYFNFYTNKAEQSLSEQLIHESIQIMGFDGYYIPKEDFSPDRLFGDNPTAFYKDAYLLSFYLSNARDPGINNDYFSKFGLEIRNNTKICVSRREFKNVVPESSTRPAEGDLVLIPFFSSGSNELYEIKGVSDAPDFYALGRTEAYYYEFDLELYKYSHEKIETGIPEIDMVNDDQAYAIALQMGTTNASVFEYEDGEYVYQGSSLLSANTIATVANWDMANNVLKVTNVIGTFANNTSVIGETSTASYILLEFNDQEKNQYRNPWDNKVIEDESDVIVDRTQVNPLGWL
jgi:hypothetical protein